MYRTLGAQASSKSQGPPAGLVTPPRPEPPGVWVTAAAPDGPRWASVSSLPPPRLRAECSLTICGRGRRLRQRAERGQGVGGPTLLCLLPPARLSLAAQ